MPKEGTKFVRIVLAALTRCEYSEIIEVSESITDEELEELVSQRYEEVDGGDYEDDTMYWEKGTCSHETITAEEAVGKIKKLKPDGSISDTVRHKETFDYSGTPPFAHAVWANEPDAPCLWCAGTGHPDGDEKNGICTHPGC